MNPLLVVLIALAVIVAFVIVRGIRIVPQQRGWVVERLGRFNRVLEPGLNVIIPIVDAVPYRFDLRETPVDIPKQVCITLDNTQVSVDGVLYFQITDARAAAYGTSDPVAAVVQLAQTTMRSAVGRLHLDQVLSSRQELNTEVVSALDEAAINWGVKVLRYEIRDISPPEEVLRAMELQITAEREKRAMIARSEGEKQQQINISEGERQQQINLAEGERQARILEAQGQGKAIQLVAEATANAIGAIAASLQTPGGEQAMRMQVAKDYIVQWGHLAKEGTAVVIPADTGDLSRMVATAMRIADLPAGAAAGGEDGR
ncbi:SPFH domain-containing protein [Acidihalobacter prosperus]|uniref:Paraslipin n=1 Tax=Acidihalobacter prosperus TaxID=160660 RepID=A0A1A6C5L8_9GAMM|nr:SPFH domain-containing protein [Acidihalobacter prosperus]OBS09858.1 paraslipin [Acidihalobacter prosperus]